MIHTETVTLRGAPLRAKGRGYAVPVSGPLTVIDMEPQDLASLAPAAMPGYASTANQPLAGRMVSGREGYWGKGIESYDKLARLLEDGWAEGTKLVAEIADEVRDLVPPVPQTARRRLVWSEQGDELDYERWVSGQYDVAWRAMRQERRVAPRVITIDADVGQNCHLSAEQLKWSGVAAAALTDALELAGYTVELFATSACIANSPKGGACLTRVQVKSALSPLNPGAVAATVALPATFRWHHIMSWLAHPQPLGGGYGQSLHLQEVLEVAAQAGALEASEIVLSGALTREEAVKLVRDAIQQLLESEETAEGSMR